MLTVEIAIATYGNTLTGEAIIKKLESFNPKIRSAINLRLAQQKLADIDSVEKRKKLTAQLLDDIRLIVDKPDTEQPSAITDVHFVKFVISEALTENSLPSDSRQKMKEQAFQMQRSLLVRFQPVSSSLSDYNAPLLAEMTNASQGGYAASYETQY